MAEQTDLGITLLHDVYLAICIDLESVKNVGAWSRCCSVTDALDNRRHDDAELKCEDAENKGQVTKGRDTSWLAHLSTSFGAPLTKRGSPNSDWSLVLEAP